LWGVLQRYRDAGGTILLTTHYMDEAEVLCDRVAIVDHGKIIALDAPKAMVTALGAPKVVVHEGTLEDVFMSLTDDICVTSNGARGRSASSAHRAHAGSPPRVRSRTRGAVLVVLFSDRHVGGDGHRLSLAGSQPARVGVPPGTASAMLRKTLSSGPGLIVRDVPAEEELRQLREGDVHVIVRPGDPPTYRFDPNREESRIARLVVDDVLKRAAGRSDPWQAREDAVAIPGSRYVDWLIRASLRSAS
jgi:hypothetical protein